MKRVMTAICFVIAMATFAAPDAASVYQDVQQPVPNDPNSISSNAILVAIASFPQALEAALGMPMQ